MAQQVQVWPGDNEADRHRTAPGGEKHVAAVSQKSLVREEQPGIQSDSIWTRLWTTYD